MTDGLELTIGGCAANVAVDLSRLGRRVAIGGRVGDDPLGRFVVDALAAENVDCSTVSVSQTSQTSGTLVVNVAGEDRRFIHSVGANVEFSGRELSQDVLRTSKIVYVGGFGLNAALSGENVAELFRTVRAAGGVTALDVVIGDPSVMRKMLEPALPETDLFFPNTDEARLILGESDPVKQATAFREMGAKTVAITCGGEGLILISPEERLRASAYKMTCVDGTGGGDAFVAGYLYGVLRGAGTRDCLQYGSAMGASCVRAMGATTAVFNSDEIEAYVAANKLTVETLP